MPFCSNCGQQLSIGTEKFCPNCGKVLKGGSTNDTRSSISIQGTGGDVIGVGVSSSSNIIGKNIVVGSGTINVNQQELSKIQYLNKFYTYYMYQPIYVMDLRSLACENYQEMR